MSVRIIGESGSVQDCIPTSVRLDSKFLANSSSTAIAIGLVDGKITE
jgi:hypothetical protein